MKRSRNEFTQDHNQQDSEQDHSLQPSSKILSLSSNTQEEEETYTDFQQDQELLNEMQKIIDFHNHTEPMGALLIPTFVGGSEEFTTLTFERLKRGEAYWWDNKYANRNICSWLGECVHSNDHDGHGHMANYLKNPNQNLMKLLPVEILLDLMFFMDKYALFNFICTCRGVYELFESVYSESIDRLRLDILNNKRDISNLNRLVDLFSNTVREPCWNASEISVDLRANESVMMTYDQYFRMKSSVKWPKSYYHDHLNFTRFKIGDPMIDLINSQAESADKSSDEDHYEDSIITVFPYGLLTQPDTYYLNFDELVKRNSKVILPFVYPIHYSYYFNPKRSTHHYIDKEPDDKNYSVRFTERIVRFFKNPYEMTFNDFQDRLKNEILKDNELARILFFECAFEHNKTTKTRERFVISGGSLLHTLTGCGFNDFDIFVINNGESDEIITKAIKQVLMKMEEKTTHLQYNIMSSKTTINICQEGKENIQIVLMKYDTIEELLLFFDLDCCKLVLDGEKVWTVVECLRSLKYKINFITRESGKSSEVHHVRAYKYACRGFKTIVAEFFHPLSHAMHCDFIIERIRKSLIEKYTKRDPEFRSNNPLVELFTRNKKGEYPPAYEPKRDNENDVLYSILLPFVNFQLVEKCITNGILYHVKKEMKRLFRCPRELLVFESENDSQVEAEILKYLKLDEYEFVKRPSNLFQILPENHNLAKGKYSYAHLVCKFCLVRCQFCSTFYYSPFQSLLLRKKRDSFTCPLQITFSENKEITQTSYNPEINMLCHSCLGKLNCREKFQDYYLKYEYSSSKFVENQIETSILQTIYKISQKESTLRGISKERLFDLLSDSFKISDLELNLKILKIKRLVIEEENSLLNIREKAIPIKTYSNKQVVPFQI